MGIDENFWNEFKQSNDFTADVGTGGDVQKYQVYLNGNWIAECDSFEEAETVVNGNVMNGSVDIKHY